MRQIAAHDFDPLLRGHEPVMAQPPELELRKCRIGEEARRKACPTLPVSRVTRMIAGSVFMEGSFFRLLRSGFLWVCADVVQRTSHTFRPLGMARVPPMPDQVQMQRIKPRRRRQVSQIALIFSSGSSARPVLAAA